MSCCAIPFERSFASHPRSANWSEQNLVQPENVALNSHQKYWFDCDNCNHKFQSACDRINIGTWCPYCANPPKLLCDNETCVLCFQKSFASHEKAPYWSDQNTLTPRQVFKNSNKIYWFNCDNCNHTFQTSCDRINAGMWCPYCTNIRLCNNDNCTMCFQTSFASHEKSLCWSSKNRLTSRQVFKNSNKTYLFICDNCNHEFQTTCNRISSGGQWCPYCVNMQLCDDNNCTMCFQNSFASHEKSQYWSSKNDLTSRQVFKGSELKIWFNCNNCNHEFQSTCKEVNSGHWCPYCANKQLCNNETCLLCFQKSFASHEKTPCWSAKNIFSPRQVFKGSSTQKYCFNCDSCNHEFESTCAHINSGGWCPYCSNPSNKLCDDEMCTLCFQKSFASHEKAQCWSDKNNLTPRQVFKNANKKYWFNCDKCNHAFQSACAHINYYGRWCPKCKNKTESILFDKIKEIYPSLIHQFAVEWCKNIRYLPFDFLIPEYNIIIELDGPQHFKQVWNWNSPETTQDLDKYKMKCAKENGYSVIRLLQEDVYENKFDWFNELTVAINKIVEETKVQIIYICKNNEYDVYLIDNDK